MFVSLPEVAEQPQRLLVAGLGRRVVAGQLLYKTEFIQRVRLAGAFTEAVPLLECLLIVGGGSQVVAR